MPSVHPRSPATVPILVDIINGRAYVRSDREPLMIGFATIHFDCTGDGQPLYNLSH
ncbi:MAG: hypothetical protein HY314_05050 [Acidobacteria bacterium]|nr:hypothetical protein [Acidobacteriota bacterium]